MDSLKRILLIAIFASSLLFIQSGEAAKLTCIQSLTSVFRNSNLKTAEKILSEHAPYDRKGFSLTPLNESTHSGVYLGCSDTGEQFILKVNALSEAFNDYYGLKVLKKLDPPPAPAVKIIDSVFLTPKNEKSIELHTKVLQKNPYAEGKPLAEILIDPNVPTSRKSELYKHYSEWLNDVARKLKNRGFEVELARPTENYFPKHSTLITDSPDFLKSQPPLLKADKTWKKEFTLPGELEAASAGMDHLLRGQFKALVNSPDGDLLILIKSDNVMVNEANEMVLFDPF